MHYPGESQVSGLLGMVSSGILVLFPIILLPLCVVFLFTRFRRKTQELAHFLSKKSEDITFLEPYPDMRRNNTSGIRGRILEFAQGEATRLGMARAHFTFARRRKET